MFAAACVYKVSSSLYALFGCCCLRAFKRWASPWMFLAAACLRVDVADREQRAGVGQPPLYSGTAYLVSSILLVLLRSNKGLNQSQLISAADVFLTDVHINPSEQALRVALLLFSSRLLDNHKLIRPTICQPTKNKLLALVFSI